MGRRGWAGTAAVAVTAGITALATSVAVASVPIGLVAYSDIARTQAGAGTTVRSARSPTASARSSR